MRVDILNTVWISYLVPKELEKKVLELKDSSDEELLDLIIENNFEQEYMYDTVSDIIAQNKQFAINQLNFPTVQVLDDNFDIIYDNGNQISKT